MNRAQHRDVVEFSDAAPPAFRTAAHFEFLRLDIWP